MSMVICDSCDALIDTDDDPDAIIELPACIPATKKMNQIICEPCRERTWERQQEKASEDAP